MRQSISIWEKYEPREFIQRVELEEKISHLTNPLHHKINRQVEEMVQRIVEKRTSQCHQITQTTQTIQITQTNQTIQIIKALIGRSMVRMQRKDFYWI